MKSAPKAERRVYIALIVTGALVAMGAEAWVLFGAPYLPYIDWSNHLGLISIFAHGEEMGALEFAERSWSPRPYLLFYAVAGGFSQIWSVPVAAKLALVSAAGLCVVSMGLLAKALDRPVIGALIASLALYGYPRGYGFASFIFTVPFVWLVLAAFEHVLYRTRTDKPLPLAVASLSGALLLCYLGHALQAFPAGLAVGLRFLVFFIGRPLRIAGRAAAALAIGVLPAVACAAIAWMDFGTRPGVTLNRADAQLMTWGSSLTSRWAGVGGHLLERGSPDHWLTMYGVAGLLTVLVVLHLVGGVWSLWLRRKLDFTEGDQGAVVYAVFFASLYVVGPESLGWPMGVWMVYPRYATVAALSLFLLPRPRLGVIWQLALAACAFGLVAHNAHLNRSHVRAFSQWASRYDAVREAVPPRSKVLALTGYDPGDWIVAHHALGSLYFYHLCDGAAYTAFLFDNPMHPVRLKSQRPEAPPWNNTGAYSPTVHGTAFDYLVLRGRRFVAPTEQAGRHDVVLRHEGWVVFKTRPESPL